MSRTEMCIFPISNLHSLVTLQTFHRIDNARDVLVDQYMIRISSTGLMSILNPSKPVTPKKKEGSG